MRILIEPGSYSCQNLGDIAMLQVAVRRLRQVWPGARLDVLTNAPSALRRYCPEARPMSTTGRALWFEERNRRGPRRRVGLAAYAHLALDRRNPRQLWTFMRALERTDLLLIAGQGSMTDATRGHALNVLGTLQLAAERGVPAVMVGQGMGPLTDPELVARARTVLPGVQRIALREGLLGNTLLQQLGVAPERIMVTGDDAVELATEATPTDLGHGIGVNLRLSGNAGIGRDTIAPVRQALVAFAGERKAPLLPAPIALGQASDAAVIRELLRGHVETDGGASFTGPLDAITQLGRCRVLFTGAYHSAVFALSQGVPAVCLVESPYYQVKFDGLCDLFGAGCTVVQREGDDLIGRIHGALTAAWNAAAALRAPLRQAAEAQIARGRAVYQSLPTLLASTPAPRLAAEVMR